MSEHSVWVQMICSLHQDLMVFLSLFVREVICADFHPIGSLKIWNMKTTACIRTLECGYAICSTFLPGDRQVCSLFQRNTLWRADGYVIRSQWVWNQARSSSSISHLPRSSKPSKRIQVRYGQYMSVRMARLWSAEAQIKMSSFGNSKENLLIAKMYVVERSSTATLTDKMTVW